MKMAKKPGFVNTMLVGLKGYLAGLVTFILIAIPMGLLTWGITRFIEGRVFIYGISAISFVISIWLWGLIVTRWYGWK